MSIEDQAALDAARDRAYARTHRRAQPPHTDAAWVWGFVCTMLAAALLMLAAFMNTAAGDFENVGLLNRRLCMTVAGCSSGLAAVVLFGIATLGREVRRWGLEMSGDDVTGE